MLAIISNWRKRKGVFNIKKLQEAYSCSDYHEAKEKLLQLRQELKPINLSAVRSLDEGLEETLTLQRLGLFEELGFLLYNYQLYRVFKQSDRAAHGQNHLLEE